VDLSRVHQPKFREVELGQGLYLRTEDEVNRPTAGSPLPLVGAGYDLPIRDAESVPFTAPTRSRSADFTASNWGGIGLMQTPSARFRSTGEFSFNLHNTRPDTNGNVFMQPFDWLEVGFRYTNISNRPYGSADFSGSQAYKDKSVDFKVRLTTESAYIPQLAVGLRDLTGTGLFSSEYLVASKRTGAFDWSLGIGWGYLAGRRDIGNPLGRLFPSFNTRTNNVGQGGNFAFGSYFHGPEALFGGVQYQTPWDKLVLKLEYDGNNYQNEPQNNNQVQKSPWNIGAVYRLYNSVDVEIGVERGTTLSIGFAVHTQLDGMTVPKLDDPPRVGVVDGRPTASPDWTRTARDLSSQTDWQILGIEQMGRDLVVTVDGVSATYLRERVDRVVAVLHRDDPASVDRFVVVYRQNGIAIGENVVDRDTWVAQRTRPVAPRDWRDEVIARAAVEQQSKSPFFNRELPRFDSGLGMNLQKNLGGPDGFVLYQISAVEKAKYRFRDDTWVQGSLQVGLLDNYNKFKFAGFSDLPRVRTYLREYLTTSDVTIPNLQLTHVGRIGQNQFYSFYGGLLEPMFAGVGGEWLYRPHASRLAFGVDVNEVQQRGFRQDFAMRDYKVLTGHATAYWDTGWNDVNLTVSAGQYLAKDIGATFTATRTFKNGVVVGGYFTKTNVSAAQFGEGSYDKGVFLSIPFDAFLTRSSDTTANFLWQPLIRDGGAKLWRAETLYGMTDIRSSRSLDYRPAPPPNDEVIPADRLEKWSPKENKPEPYTRVTAKVSAKQWVAEPKSEDRLHDALYAQYFRDIRIEFDSSYRLIVRVASDRIAPISLAVGRVARTVLRLAPLETREIRVEFSEQDVPLAVYDFVDLNRLDDFFQGKLSQRDLSEYVAVEYLDRGVREANPLARLDDLEPIPARRLIDVVTPDSRTVTRVVGDFSGAVDVAASTDWLRLGLIGSGLVLGSSLLDSRVDRVAKRFVDKTWVKTGVKIGNALPFLAIGGAAIAALDSSDPNRSRTSYAALEAGGTAFLTVTGLKYAIGRARPTNELGSKQFKFFTNAAGYDSFPSGHTIEAWSVLTPFAEEYQAPWLYGVAAITNLARIGSRQHWLSDTVAGSVMGYGIGQFFYRSSLPAKKGEPRVSVDPTGINVAWQW
jgi:membrane-associated phospholipid phosphatase